MYFQSSLNLQLGHFPPLSFLCIFVFFIFHVCIFLGGMFHFLKFENSIQFITWVEVTSKYWLGYGKFLVLKQNMSRSWSKNVTNVRFNLINVDNLIVKKKWFTMIKYIGQTPTSSFIEKDDKYNTSYGTY